MELPTAFRTLVGAHRLLIAMCIVLPLAVVGAFSVKKAPLYSATARLQATDTTIGSDTEADSVLNLVRGIATSSDVVRRALRDAGMSGHGAAYIAAHQVTLTRLGSSPVIDLGVTDANPADAVKIAGALAGEVVTFLRDDSQQPSLQLMSRLRSQENSLARQRDQLSTELNAATTANDVSTLSTTLSNVEQQLTQTAGALQQLEVTTAAASSAAVIARPTAATRVASSTILRLVLAGFGGLVIGLLLAALREMVKPRIADARDAARHLDAPLLGVLSEAAPDPLTAMSVRRVAERAHLTMLVVAGRHDASTAAALTEQFLLHSLSTATKASAGAATNGSPSGANGAAALGIGLPKPGAIAAATRAKLAHELSTGQPGPAVRVVALSEIAARDLDEITGLLFAASPRMPMSALTRIRDVAAATGWPIVGVLDAGK